MDRTAGLLFLLLALASCAGGRAAPAGASSPAARPTAAPPATSRATASAPPATAAPAPALEAFFEGPPSAEEPWPRGDAAGLGFDPSALSAIVAEAERTGSDSLLIVRDGTAVVDRTFGKPRGPIDTMSVTKSIVSIALGLLIDEGKISSVDAPLSTWFPAWSSGPKAEVTLRHVLTQSSGLKHEKGTRVLNQHDDRLAFVEQSPVVDEPGKVFSYNNEATLLLSGVIRAAAGQDVEAYLASKLFGPLGITEWSWRTDPSGTVLAHAGLALSARDLAKIGQLMLQGGVWKGERLLSAEWVEASTASSTVSPHYGYLWWIRHDDVKRVLTKERLESLRARGFSAVDKLADFVDRPLSGARAWMELGALLSEGERAELTALVEDGVVLFNQRRGEAIAFAADGWLGQALIVSRPLQLIVVRQHRKPRDREVDDAYNQQHGFFSLGTMLKASLRPAMSQEPSGPASEPGANESPGPVRPAGPTTKEPRTGGGSPNWVIWTHAALGTTALVTFTTALGIGAASGNLGKLTDPSQCCPDGGAREEPYRTIDRTLVNVGIGAYLAAGASALFNLLLYEPVWESPRSSHQAHRWLAIAHGVVFLVSASSGMVMGGAQPEDPERFANAARVHVPSNVVLVPLLSTALANILFE
ncbi:MAG: serine hydrolase [Deltaproteobacteria bacterium]|jgi:CubicO group peptidase (beta-lactamase class C family)|nr:serine hydrolase [Deltaproteobacteria bacterium]MBW2536940.1 serine hydrolase [Deltaproteobacteria bacterium]